MVRTRSNGGASGLATERRINLSEYPVLENAYTDLMMVAERSGDGDAGRWVRERRNVLQDYRAAFVGKPPPANAVAIMTDTDNTGGEATAYYGDIVFRAGADTLHPYGVPERR